MSRHDVMSPGTQSAPNSPDSFSAISAVNVRGPVPDRADRRPIGSIGRHARLELVFAQRRGRTILAHAYAEAPFRVGRCLDASPYAHVIVTCCGPGVFAGDVLEQHLTVERGARVLLVSQAALQLHPSLSAAPAVLRSRVEIEPDAELEGFWDPLIPFAGAWVDEHVELHVADTARVFWSDALMTGRVGRGERWQFAEVGREMRVSIAGELQYLERYRLTPGSRAVDRPWIAGGADYIGTAIARDPEATSSRAEMMQRALTGQSGVHAGVDALMPGLIVARVLANRGPAFAAARTAIRDAFTRPSLRRL